MLNFLSNLGELLLNTLFIYVISYVILFSAYLICMFGFYQSDNRFILISLILSFFSFFEIILVTILTII
jgi:hypothetical protein